MHTNKLLYAALGAVVGYMYSQSRQQKIINQPVDDELVWYNPSSWFN
jgi:hypothetical protein